MIDLLNPIQAGIPSAERIIRMIFVVYGGVFLYSIIRGYKLISFFIADFPRFPLAAVVTLFPFLLLPVALLIFYKRKPAGWMLLTAYVLFTIVLLFCSLLLTLVQQPYDLTHLSSLDSPSSAVTYIYQLLFLGATLYALSRRDVRSAFLISRNRAGTTIFLAVVLIIFFFLVMFFS